LLDDEKDGVVLLMKKYRQGGRARERNCIVSAAEQKENPGGG